MMNDLESLRHEAEQLKNAIRVSDTTHEKSHKNITLVMEGNTQFYWGRESKQLRQRGDLIPSYQLLFVLSISSGLLWQKDPIYGHLSLDCISLSMSYRYPVTTLVSRF